MSETYHRLMACESGEDAFDRHVFACVIAKAMTETQRSLHEAVGLAPDQLVSLWRRYFPGAVPPDAQGSPGAGDDALEEPDLRRLLADNATRPGDQAAIWLAAMVARRSLLPNHLWQDLGLAARSDLSGLLHRHFAPLATRNVRDMKWKKFFYRQLCEAEGISICKSPVCDACSDFTLCYGPEA
ncbi:MAG TPA: nitrogen fixation protein NifQ [Magnetospirillum sp.]|nr:nitrogen fixation protein NifQ [Magnetospirillum sp.]